MFLVYVVLCLIVFDCQYQCNSLPGKTRLQNDVPSVSSGTLNPTHTHSLTYCAKITTVGLSLHLLFTDLSDASSLTERTSNNKRLGTSNDTTSVAKHPTLKSQLD